MNTINKHFVLLQVLVQLFSVASYTVVLKQVKPLYPSIKVYKYELRQAKVLPESSSQVIHSKPPLGQRIYPVAMKFGRDVHFKTRMPLKKENGRLYKVSSMTEKPIFRDPRLLGLSQNLVPPVSNQIEEYSEATKEEGVREEENDVRPLLISPHSSKSFSSFGQEKGRIYNNPGDWATPVPQINPENASKIEFTPSQLYLQIRHKNTVIHVPQSEALKDAETLEELINAPRLKELSRTTHVQETYSEEGYEDAGYDHAGHFRQVQHGEVYDAKDEGRFKIKAGPVILNQDSDLEESKKVPLKNASDNLLPQEGNISNKPEPRITRSQSELSKTSADFTETPKNYKGEHKYSSRVRSSLKKNEKSSPLDSTNMKKLPNVHAVFPSYFGEMPPAPEIILANDSVVSVKKSSKYRNGDFNSTKIYPVSKSVPPETSPVNKYTDFHPYISQIDSQPSPSAKSLKYSRIYSKKTKQLLLEPFQNENIYSPPPPPPPPPPPSLPRPNDLQPPHFPNETGEEEPINQRIVLPTIGYINSLTTAHFGKESPKPVQEESKPQLTNALNLTQALKYLRSNKNQQDLEITKNPTEIDIGTFEPMKIKKYRSNAHSFVNKTKRDVYLIGIRGKRSNKRTKEYEDNDETDLPYNEKNEEIAEDERKKIEEENWEKEKYEKDLKSEITKQEEQIIKETYKNIGVEGDVSEAFPEFPSSNSDFDSSETSHLFSFPLETTQTPINNKKYPFYMSKKLPENSALRYATDPKQFPKKSGYKMEFYESREQLIQCPDFHPNVDDLPDSKSRDYSDEQAGENERLRGVGDKIACLRMKYFDPEPFDNPIFKEKEIDYVGKPVKGREKVRTKILPKTGDETLQRTLHQKSYEGKLKNLKLNKKLHGSDLNPSLQTSYISQETSQEIKNQSTETPKVFVQAILPLKASESGKMPTIQRSQINEFPFYARKTFQNISFPSPAIGWKTFYRSKSRPRVASKLEPKNRIVKSYNCLPHINQLVILDATKNVTIICKDVILIQEIRGNVPYLRVIPKEKKALNEKWIEKLSLQSSSDQSVWVPIVGYTLHKHSNGSRKPLSRRTDEVTKLRNETSQNPISGHYVIDELKEDENVRKGEVVEDMVHYLELMEDSKDKIQEVTTVKTELKAENTTRKKREAQNGFVKPKKQSNFSKVLEFSLDKALQTQISSKGDRDKTLDELSTFASKPFEQKRPLKRLSGLDFLVRYHRNKNKPSSQRTEDFWKITTEEPVINNNVHKSQKKRTEIVTRTTSRNPNYTNRLGKTIISHNGETTTEKYEIKEAFVFRKHHVKSSNETFYKPKRGQANESRKISPSKVIEEKITKRPPGKPSEVWKFTTENLVTERTATKPVNFTKIITKVSTKASETSEKPRFVYKQAILPLNQDSSTEIPRRNSDGLKYKTINRNSTSFQHKNFENLSKPTENPEGPTLYYVVNLNSGRGKWITNYDEKSRSSEKHPKPQKGKEVSGLKKDGRKKKI